ncbi:MAG: SufE family protein [Bacteroidota bacterium]|nr:SufE family protein [Bacteroidota bacterium]
MADKIQDTIIEDLEMFEDWTDKYEYLIAMGNELNAMPDEKKNESNLIKGCQSRVWIDAELKDGNVHFTADSDAIITKGIVSLLLKVWSKRTPKEILNSNLYFIEQTGLKENLSPTRANGLVSMIKKMKTFALAFNSMKK